MDGRRLAVRRGGGALGGELTPARAARGRRRGAGLYLHLPFCATRCSYCTVVTSTELGTLPRTLAAAERGVASADLEACAELAPAFGAALADFLALGLARRRGDRVRCTPRGWLVSNELLSALW